MAVFCVFSFSLRDNTQFPQREHTEEIGQRREGERERGREREESGQGEEGEEVRELLICTEGEGDGLISGGVPRACLQCDDAVNVKLHVASLRRNVGGQR